MQKAEGQIHTNHEGSGTINRFHWQKIWRSFSRRQKSRL